MLGTEKLDLYLQKYGLTLDPKLRDLIGKKSRRPWNKFISERNEGVISPAALDLLDRLLRYDHQERLTSKEALAHHFFNPVKEWEENRGMNRKNVTTVDSSHAHNWRP